MIFCTVDCHHKFRRLIFFVVFCPPRTDLVCFGIPVNTVTHILSIPKDKLSEIISMCHTWETKASLTSHRTCRYVLVTEKNRLICKGHLRYTCDFLTKYQGRTGPAMKICMHIFSAYTQDIYKRIHASRVTYSRLRQCILLASVVGSPHLQSPNVYSWLGIF